MGGGGGGKRRAGEGDGEAEGERDSGGGCLVLNIKEETSCFQVRFNLSFFKCS